MKSEREAVTPLEYYYEKQEIVVRECLFALRGIVMSVNANIIHKRKYQIPFFSYNDFDIAFLWVRKKKILLGFIEDKKFIQKTEPTQKKSKVKTIDIIPIEDIPIKEIEENIKQLIAKYNLKN
ncbi:DUF1801 domain-containing protein [Sphingobacterium sp. 18053]|uniref:DUF1801 domain-containing protein n=1 Tax=Sphingobacterium sp. 18053 TaxID=2681401 RepID=UPI001F20872B|nr:DUF1801 domain-containing protein [Sphingobacterium sp. 18053]